MIRYYKRVNKIRSKIDDTKPKEYSKHVINGQNHKKLLEKFVTLDPEFIRKFHAAKEQLKVREDSNFDKKYF